MSKYSAKYTEEMLEDMRSFCMDIFHAHFIFDRDVQLSVSAMILDDNTFLDYSSTFTQLHAQMDGQPWVGRDDPFDMKRPTLNISAGLDMAQRTALVTENEDVKLLFHDGVKMPHGKAFAQRIVDTRRLVDAGPRNQSMLDIGGNWTLYARRQQPLNTHCCNLCVGEVEMHRQVQREVSMDLENISIPECLKCEDGVQNCDAQAIYGYSLHVLPEIDPESWVSIFDKHGLLSAKHVFHYDVAIEVQDEGVIVDAEMAWRVLGEDVEFHFMNDSSHSYIHKRSWLMKYATTFIVDSPEYDFIVYSQVDFIKGGRAQVSMTRMEKSTLGRQDVTYQFRYVEGERMVDIAVPRFDPNGGRVITDVAAYTMEYVRIPERMFDYTYRRGVSNDTSNPTTAYSLAEMRAAVDTYNHVRTLNGTQLTATTKMPASLAGDVALGMYMLVAYEAAKERLQYGRYTVQMKDVQKRWGAASMMWMLTRTVSAFVMLPFAALAQTFEELVDVVTVYMRVTAKIGAVEATYRRVSPVRMLDSYQGDYRQGLGGLVMDQRWEDAAFDMTTPADVKRLYDLCGSMFSEDVRNAMEKLLAEAQIQADEEVDDDLDAQQTQPMSAMPEFETTRSSWIDAHETFDDSLDYTDIKEQYGTKVAVGSVEQVHSFYLESMYEYALYKVDEGIHAVESSTDLCRATWNAGEPNAREVASVNSYREVGVKYFSVKGGMLIDVGEVRSLAYVINPIDMMPHRVMVTKEGGYYVSDETMQWAFTCNELSIHNGFDLAKKTREQMKRYTGQRLKWTMMDAIAGAGKTHSIVNAFTAHDVIVCAVRHTADETLQQLINLKENGQPKFAEGLKTMLARRVRSLDSATLHGIPRARVLYVDEGLMAHAGQLRAVALASRASEVRVYGDPSQIGMIERGSKLGTLHFESLFYWTAIIEFNETFRLPADALIAHSWFHDDPERRVKLRTYNPLMRSITFLPLTGIDDASLKVPIGGCHYMTVLQADKGLLVTSPGFDDAKKVDSVVQGRATVATVHESQGASKPSCALVRINPKSVGMLGSRPHLNVGFTRHTVSLVVRSTRGPDECPLAKYATQAEKLSEDELRSVMLPAPQWLVDKITREQKWVVGMN